MRKATVKYIESELQNFEESKQLIKEMELDAIYCRTVYENIGGGKSNKIHSSTERAALKFERNRTLENLKRTVNAIQRVYDDCSESYKKLIYLRYWGKESKSWCGIAQDLYVSERKALYMKKEIVEEISNAMGLV